jgi:phage anti-repressor protein
MGGSSLKHISIVSESGLYKLIMRSDKPDAVAFQNWVTKEVLPSIRKTGGYLLNEQARTTAHADTKGAMPKDQFQKWMQSRIEDYGFLEGDDFSSIRIKTKGRPRTDYLLTIDMAKELAMVERLKTPQNSLLKSVASKKVPITAPPW